LGHGPSDQDQFRHHAYHGRARLADLLLRPSLRHLIAISGDAWSDELRLSDIESRFVCSACGKRGADVRAGLQLEQDAAREVITLGFGAIGETPT
jgi:hypothetical protein